VRKVVVEYHQGWLATAVESNGSKQAAWRVDPALSGLAGAMGDIGSHAENLLSTVTGLEIEALCADLSAMGAGRTLDDDGNVLLQLSGGARGVLIASQITTGSENDLRIRISGSEGSLSWAQENPNQLLHAPLDGAPRRLTRASAGLCDSATRASRLPAGHPEGFIEAFANVYLGVAADIRARMAGVPADPLAADYPRIDAGARGVRFIEKVLESATSAQKWTSMKEGTSR
jgi:predicted dehydrogenase